MRPAILLVAALAAAAALGPAAAQTIAPMGGACGPAVNARCPASQCCSQYGWCGIEPAHCGAGCQAAWGTCNNAPPTAAFTNNGAVVTVPGDGMTIVTDFGPGYSLMAGALLGGPGEYFGRVPSSVVQDVRQGCIGGQGLAQQAS